MAAVQQDSDYVLKEAKVDSNKGLAIKKIFMPLASIKRPDLCAIKVQVKCASQSKQPAKKTVAEKRKRSRRVDDGHPKKRPLISAVEQTPAASTPEKNNSGPQGRYVDGQNNVLRPPTPRSLDIDADAEPLSLDQYNTLAFTNPEKEQARKLIDQQSFELFKNFEPPKSDNKPQDAPTASKSSSNSDKDNEEVVEEEKGHKKKSVQDLPGSTLNPFNIPPLNLSTSSTSSADDEPPVLSIPESAGVTVDLPEWADGILEIAGSSTTVLQPKASRPAPAKALVSVPSQASRSTAMKAVRPASATVARTQPAPVSTGSRSSSSSSSLESNSKMVPVTKTYSNSAKSSVPSADLAGLGSHVEHNIGSGNLQSDTASTSVSKPSSSVNNKATARKSSSKPLSKIAKYRLQLESHFRASRVSSGFRIPQSEKSRSPESNGSSKVSTASSSRSSSSAKTSSSAKSLLRSDRLNTSTKSETPTEKKKDGNPTGVRVTTCFNNNNIEKIVIGKGTRAVLNPASRGIKTTKFIAPIDIIAPSGIVTKRMKLLNEIYRR